MKEGLLIIDMLKDFVEEDGSLKVNNAKNIINNIKKRIELARKNDIPIIYICDSHIEEDKEFEVFPRHAVVNTVGSQIIDELTPQKNDFIIYKRRYSGFFETGLDLLLRELKVDELILTGLVTNICVYHTAADAYFRGYKLKVVKDAVVALSEEENEWALAQMKKLFNAKII